MPKSHGPLYTCHITLSTLSPIAQSIMLVNVFSHDSGYFASSVSHHSFASSWDTNNDVPEEGWVGLFKDSDIFDGF